MNTLRSYASDKLLQLIFYSHNQKGKREHPICREGKHLQERTLPGTSPPKKAEEGTSEKSGEGGTPEKSREEAYIDEKISLEE